MPAIRTKTIPTWSTRLLQLETERAPQFIDITDQVLTAIDESRVCHGHVVVFSRHTTAAIKINEHEPELLKDMELFLRRIAPSEEQYFHNDFTVRTVNMTEDESPNAHAHCQHLLLSTSETIPICNGQIQLGCWQRIFLVELDRPRSREVVVQVYGFEG